MRQAGPLSALVTAMLATALAGCGLLDPDDEPAQEQILFMIGGYAAKDIHRVSADGSGLVNLTRSLDEYQSLDVTRDGRTVVFDRQSDCRIVSMAPDGSSQKPLGPLCARMPRLSPNDRLIAYEAGNAIHVMAIDGTGSREVSTDLPPVQPTPCGQIPKSSVLPFGWISTNRLTFRRHICGVGNTFYSVNADGSGLVEIDFNPQSAHLSPDATEVAFDLIGDSHEDPNVTVMNADGSNRRVVAAGGWLPDRFSHSRSPWSPDGRQLYFRRADGHYVVDVRSGAARRLPEPQTDAAFLGWSPRSSRMLFMVNERDQTGVISSDIYVVSADGSRSMNLTRSDAFDTGAVWLP